jgi:putative ABC transport system permease protein
MSWLRRLFNTFRPSALDRDIERELSFHLAERTDDLRAQGLSPDEATRHKRELSFHLADRVDDLRAAGAGDAEARRQARLQFGNALVMRERTRDVDVAHWLDVVFRNVRHGVRGLLRTPGFTVTVVVILAFGIGANSAVFAALDAIVLRPLPFPQHERLVRIQQIQGSETTIAPTRLEDWNRSNSTFDALSGYYVEDVSDTTRELPELLRRAVVAPRFLETLGIAPATGRTFTETEHRFGGPPAVIISDTYWRSRLGANPDVLSRTVRIADRSYSVVGVMPSQFAFPDSSVDAWSPYPIDSPALRDAPATRQLRWYTGIGRLRPGTSLELAYADLRAIQVRLGRRYERTDATVDVRIVPLRDTVGGSVRSSLWMLFGAVSLLLLSSCTNVAALLLSRSARRRHEVAVRYSLGASRSTIAGQFLTETALLACGGTAAGLAVAAGILTAFDRVAPGLTRFGELRIEPRTLIYTIACTVAVALLCALLPAMRGVREIASTSREGPTQHSLQWMLVGVQIALSVTLLSGAALLVSSLEALSRVEPGFDAARVLAFRLSGNWNENYDDPGGLVQRVNTTLDELVRLPGIEGAGTSWTLPGAPGPYQTEFEQLDGPREAEQQLLAGWRTVSPGYFDVMQIPLVEGGLCRSRLTGIHRPGPSMDLMVNRRFADRYFAGRSPIGTQLSWENGSLAGRVVGVVSDVRELGIDHETVPTVYACDNAPNPFPWIVVRTSGAPSALAVSVRQRLSQIEPLRSVYDLAPLDEHIGNAYEQNRLRTWLLTLFATTALLLTCAGVYGTLSFAVDLRRREVALRLALGALRRTVVHQLMATTICVVGVAAACGLALALLFTQNLSSMLYGVTPADPPTLAGVLVVVIGVALLAAVIPAVRATVVQPIRVLREE